MVRDRFGVRLLFVVILTTGGLACVKDSEGGGKDKAPALAGTLRAGEAPAPDAVVAPSRTLRGSSFRFVAPTRAPQPSGEHERPLSLTASDGTGLTLRALVVRGVIESPLAFTELRLTFYNPQPRVIEGRFRITLPPGAAVSRFAMKIGDRWQEGEVVERQAARRAYEDFLHRRQDPALLEQQGGNEFSARVFPIPANGVKELILSYSQSLESADATYVIPLQGLPELGTLDIRVLVARRTSGGSTTSLGGSIVTQEAIEVRKEGWTPNEDFEVKAPAVDGRLGLRHENLVVARITPIVGTKPTEIESLFVLFDTSASRALGFHAQVDQLRRLADGLAAGAGKDVPFAVAAFDQQVQLVHQGNAGTFGAEAVRTLRERRALGASDLASALDWLSRHLETTDTKYARVLVITDGVATAGETEGDTLRAAVKKLGNAGVRRLDTLVVGGLRDEHLLRELVTAGLPVDGVVIDGDDPIEEIARRLTESTASGIEVKVAGARWVWPKTLDGIQSGDQVLVFADLEPGQDFELQLEGAQLATDRVRLDPVERPLLERAWVNARMKRLLHQRETLAAGDDDLRAALKKQVIELSTKHRVLSRYTALLVLETEADYARFGIDRRALADILTVSDSGLTLLERSASATPPPVVTSADKETEKAAAPRKKAKARNGHPADDDGEFALEGGEDLPAAEPEFKLVDESGLDGLFGLRGASADALAGNEERTAAPPPAPTPPTEALEEVARAIGRPQEADARVPRGASRRRVARPRSAPARHRRADDARALLSRRTVQGVLGAGGLGVSGVGVGGGGTASVEKVPREDPWTGRFLEVMVKLRKGEVDAAVELARGWREEEPGDVLALIALGEALEASGDFEEAARAYGSLIDLFPARADLRRYAGERLEGLKGGMPLAADTYGKAVEQRPDHPASHRLYAFALLRLGKHQEAFEALEAGLERDYPQGRFAAAKRILAEDLALIAAAWLQKEPARRDDLTFRLRAHNAKPETEPSLRFVLVWETDANDVDFHIYDGQGGHAFYSQKQLPSGGELYADVTTGYGPECFTIRGKRRATPYKLQAHYYRRGPMGYGMGLLQIIDHDGKGHIVIEPRPFVVMKDGAYLDLGVVE